MAVPRDQLSYVEYLTKSGAKDRIYADAWISEDFDASCAITEHALEDGAIASDHIRPEQIVCTIEMFFSENPTRGDLDDKLRGAVDSIALPEYTYPDLTPLLSPKGITDLAGKGVSAAASLVGLGGPAKPTHYSALKFAKAPGRFRIVLSKLMQLRADSELVTLGLSAARLRNMSLEKIAFKRTSEDGADGRITLTCRQLSFVTTKSAAAAPLPVEVRAQPKQASVTVSLADLPEGPKQTVAQGLLNSARGL